MLYLTEKLEVTVPIETHGSRGNKIYSAQASGEMYSVSDFAFLYKCHTIMPL